MALAIVACALLAYRVVALERELEQLAAQLERQAGEGDTPGAADAGELSRISALEGELARLRAQVSGLGEATRDKVDAEEVDQQVSDGRILSVVRDEEQRVLEAQVEFQRGRMVEHRHKAVSTFVRQYQLDATQEQRLRALLTAEVDRMTELARSDEMRDNPAQVAADWAAELERTDRQAEALLDERQAQAWREARRLERHVLWPWLPEEED